LMASSLLPSVWLALLPADSELLLPVPELTLVLVPEPWIPPLQPNKVN